MNFSCLFRKLMMCRRGQAMTEFAVVAPILVILLLSIIYISDFYVIKIKVLTAARYGAWQIARNQMDENTIDMNIVDNTKLNDSDVTNIETPDQPLKECDDGGDNMTSVLSGIDKSVEDALSFFLDPESETTGFHVTYNVPVKLESKLGPHRFRDDYEGKNFHIIGSHYVDGNSWNGCDIDVHDMVDLIFEPIKDFF